MTDPPVIIVWDFCPNYVSFYDTATVVKTPPVFRSSLCVVDFPGLNDCGVIEEKRAEVLKAFRAYTTGEDTALSSVPLP